MTKLKRNKFNLSNQKKLSCNMGELVPVGLTEVLPGDTFQQSSNMFLRVSPLATPVMHKCKVRFHHFFVPTRILWTGFEDFITGGPDGNDDEEPPYIVSPSEGGFAVGSLADYLGCPTGVPNLRVSAIPFRLYAFNFNENYRDQDLVTPLVWSKASGLDTTTNTTLQRCAWIKDYFTSARPWSQKGAEVLVPLGTEAPVVTDGTGINLSALDGSFNNSAFATTSNPSYSPLAGPIAGGLANKALKFGSNTGLMADLSDAIAAPVNTLRLAFALQRFKEARSKYGSRYSEYLAFNGVKSSDARLQRPEYLGGGQQIIQFSEVLQTAPVSGEGVGNLFGHGAAALRTNRYRTFFEEHGYVITLMSVVPESVYMQGLPRTFSRLTKEDYFQRELQQIGQQEVLKKEIYAQGTSVDEETFGYQDRYDEYRYQPSTVAGEFRTVLKDWHMAREFSALPVLNASFVGCVPTDRVYQSTTTDQLYCTINHNISAHRMLLPTGASSAIY